MWQVIKILVVSILLVYSFTHGNTTECLLCMDNSRIYTRNLFPSSQFEFECVNKSTHLSLGSVVLNRACNHYECLLLSQDQGRVYYKPHLCREDHVTVKCSHGDKPLYSICLIIFTRLIIDFVTVGWR